MMNKSVRNICYGFTKWNIKNIDIEKLIDEVDLGPDPDEMRQRKMDDKEDERGHERVWDDGED